MNSVKFSSKNTLLIMKLSKLIPTTFLLFLILFSCKEQTQTNYIDTIKEYQYNMNKTFANKETTPFNDEDFKKFRKLDFFPIDSMYRVHADFKLNENPTVFEMGTTTDRKPLYSTYGTATFTLNGKEVKLHIYQCKDKNSPSFYDALFIPFRDKTSGGESYGGGRYIEPDFPKNGKMVIDFNLSYNPYCLYNVNRSCPIPPKENTLPIAIKAGIKNYEKSGH